MKIIKRRFNHRGYKNFHRYTADVKGHNLMPFFKLISASLYFLCESLCPFLFSLLISVVKHP
jgi:hypothetical protein